jgi:hypothetical protein
METWEVRDLVFRAASPDPFGQSFGARFTHETGASLSVPGFFDGDERWIVRFAPNRPGRWVFRTFASVPGLADNEGSLDVVPSTRPGRHGAVTVSGADSRRFVAEDGSPYFALAFELDWLFALDFGNVGGLPRSEALLTRVVENGFNQVVLNVYAYDAPWGERDRIQPRHNFARPPFCPYGGTNEAPDCATLNLALFRHLDRVLALLHEKELVAHLMIYVWNKGVTWAAPGSAGDNLYFDYVVKRYQAFPNLIWDISKEALAYGRDDLGYITDRIERLRGLDGYRRPVTVHDYDYCRVHPDKVDFISVQEWRPDLFGEMRTVAERHPDRPVVNIEHGGYEKTRHSIFDGAYTDAIVCLDRNYQCAFAGVYSTYYWQSAAWYEVVHDPETLPPGERPRLDYLRHLAALFRRYPFEGLRPTQYYFSPPCLTDGERHFLFHLPAGMISLEGRAPPELRGANVAVSWFNPLDGTHLVGERRGLAATTDAWMGFRKPASLPPTFVVAILSR